MRLLKWMVPKLVVVAINKTRNSSNPCTPCWPFVSALVGSPALAGTTSVSYRKKRQLLVILAGLL